MTTEAFADLLFARREWPCSRCPQSPRIKTAHLARARTSTKGPLLVGVPPEGVPSAARGPLFLRQFKYAEESIYDRVADTLHSRQVLQERVPITRSCRNFRRNQVTTEVLAAFARGPSLKP